MDTQDPAPSAQARRPSFRSWMVLAVMVLGTWGGSQAINWWRGERATEVLQTLAQPGDILMLTTTSCPYCAKARAWMSAHKVPWVECNVETDARCALLFQAQGSPGVPLMRVKGQWRLGFDPASVSEALQTGQ